MNQELKDYIQKKRADGISDVQISTNLIAAGWPEEMVYSSIKANLDDDVPPPPAPLLQQQASASTLSAAVLENDDEHINGGSFGVEHLIMMLSLWIAVGSFSGLLHTLLEATVNPGTVSAAASSGISPVATAGLLVSLPVFTFLFFRTRREEEQNPILKRNKLRRFGIQAALVIAFLTAICHIGWGVYSLMSGGGDSYYDDPTYNPAIEVGHILITVALASGVIFYFQRQIRKEAK